MHDRICLVKLDVLGRMSRYRRSETEQTIFHYTGVPLAAFFNGMYVGTERSMHVCFISIFQKYSDSITLRCFIMYSQGEAKPSNSSSFDYFK